MEAMSRTAKRALVAVLDRLDEVFDEVLYRPAVVRGLPYQVFQ
jgi:hypothetical protein